MSHDSIGNIDGKVVGGIARLIMHGQSLGAIQVTDPAGGHALKEMKERLPTAVTVHRVPLPSCGALDRRLDLELERLWASVSTSKLGGRSITLALCCEHAPEERSDRGLIGGDGIEVAHSGSRPARPRCISVAIERDPKRTSALLAFFRHQLQFFIEAARSLLSETPCGDISVVAIEPAGLPWGHSIVDANVCNTSIMAP